MIVQMLLSIMPLALAIVSVQDQDTILAMHNGARSSVDPPAGNMMQLTWDESLAASAQAWAQTCPTSHSLSRNNVGENLAWGSPSLSATRAVQLWLNEKSSYSFGGNTCAGTCGHYTQAIWADTNRVGCGMQVCGPGSTGNPTTSWVCHYSPAGNYIGERPYQANPSCSLCPQGFRCLANLCSPIETSQLLPTTVCHYRSPHVM
jgi:hypothetical protein